MPVSAFQEDIRAGNAMHLSAIPLGTLGFVILGYFVVVGTSNAVNLTDGLDGLAAGLSATRRARVLALAQDPAPPAADAAPAAG